MARVVSLSPTPSGLAARIAAALEGVTPANPEAPDHLRPFYAPDVRFRDPVQALTGIDAFLALNRRLLRRTKSIAWTIHYASGDEHDVTLEWSMRAVTRLRLAIEVDGMSRLRLANGLIVDHRDYWDVGEMLASIVPGASTVLRALRTPLA
jgi:limonene-1,2-epoxide hydrolase